MQAGGYTFMDMQQGYKVACQSCSRQCLRVHGNWRRSLSRPACFYTSVTENSVDEGQACWMPLPLAFVRRYLREVRRRRMILENVDGWRWPVMYSAQVFYFGWREFSADNELVAGDMIMFTLVEEDRFVVRVFSEASGCEKSIAGKTPSSSTKLRDEAAIGPETRFAPTPTLASKGTSRFLPGESESEIQREIYYEMQNNKNREGREGRYPRVFCGSGGSSHDSGDNNGVSHNVQRDKKELKGRTSETRKRSQSVPEKNIPTQSRTGFKDVEVGSLEISRRHSTCSRKMQQGYLREKQSPKWRKTQSQIRARALVEKAKLRKMNFTDLPAYSHKPILKNNQNSLNKEYAACSMRSDREGIEDSPDFDGELRVHSAIEGRSYTTQGVFVSSDEEEEEARPGLRNSKCTAQGKTKYEMQHNRSQDFDLNNPLGIDPKTAPTTTDHAFKFENVKNANNLSGSPRVGSAQAHQQQQNPVEIHDNAIRKPGRPIKYPLATSADQRPRKLPESARNGYSFTVNNQNSIEDHPPTRRKRGRPFKYETSSDMLSNRPLREIFVSRRRPVTQSERDTALNAAYAFASRMTTSVFIVVMRQSFIYRNFVLGIPRKYGHRYMPGSNKEVRLCDSACKAWYCSWNAAYRYISGRGWRNFALEHCLEEDDALIFEIVAESKSTLTMVVHIFRVVAIPDGLTGWQSHICPPTCFPELHSGAPITPRLPCSERTMLPGSRSHERASGKRIKREVVNMDAVSAMTESSEELD